MYPMSSQNPREIEIECYSPALSLSPTVLVPTWELYDYLLKHGHKPASKQDSHFDLDEYTFYCKERPTGPTCSPVFRYLIDSLHAVVRRKKFASIDPSDRALNQICYN